MILKLGTNLRPTFLYMIIYNYHENTVCETGQFLRMCYFGKDKAEIKRYLDSQVTSPEHTSDNLLHISLSMDKPQIE